MSYYDNRYSGKIPEPVVWVDDEEVALPSKMEVCWVCEGRGKHVNPNIDYNGLSEESTSDPEFMDNYMSGLYDVTCNTCNGRNVVPVLDRERCDPTLLKLYKEQEEDLRYDCDY